MAAGRSREVEQRLLFASDRLGVDEHRLFNVASGGGQRQVERHGDDEFVVVQAQHQTVAEHDPLDEASSDPRFRHFLTLASAETAHKGPGRGFP
jgi:hypothetical protein